jgi:hypothetical protein
LVGKAKVISYNNTVEAQVERNTTELTTRGGKRSPKRKGYAPILVKAKMKRKLKLEVAKDKFEVMALGYYFFVFGP